MSLVLALLPALAPQAQPLSGKPLRIVVPFGAGGVADVTSRVVAQQLSTQLGQAVIIENKPSAGGIVAADTVVKSAPDGHTLFLLSNGSAVTVNLFRQLPFDLVQDLTPISTLGYFDIGVITDGRARFQSLNEVVAYAKAHPGQLNIGSINVGSTQHLAAELFKSAAGINAQIVPFNGTPAVVMALRGRQIDVAVEILAPLTGQIQSQAVKLLAVAGAQRSALLPAVPTAQEAGVPGFVAASWNALAVPSRTPPAVVQRLHQEIAPPGRGAEAACAPRAGPGQHARTDGAAAAVRNPALGRGDRKGPYPQAVRAQPAMKRMGSSVVSHQPSAISHQPSAISHQPSAISHQPSDLADGAWMVRG